MRGVEPHLDQGCVFDLSQNPGQRPTWTSPNGAVPCFRRNSMLWIPSQKRLLCPSESARMMGFPSNAVRVSQEAVGNAMSVQTVGLMLITALVCAEPM